MHSGALDKGGRQRELPDIESASDGGREQSRVDGLLQSYAIVRRGQVVSEPIERCDRVYRSGRSFILELPRDIGLGRFGQLTQDEGEIVVDVPDLPPAF